MSRAWADNSNDVSQWVSVFCGWVQSQLYLYLWEMKWLLDDSESLTITNDPPLTQSSKLDL